MMWQLNVATICLAFRLNVLITDIGAVHVESVTKENHSNLPDLKNVSNMQEETNSSNYITTILEKARTKIKHDTSNFNFSQSGVNGLEDLVIESGGQPLRNFVVSTWRSGSNFLGDLVFNAFPSNFYTCEPLIMYDLKQFKSPKEVSKALSIVKGMLRCNYEGSEDYFNFARKYLDGKWQQFNSHNVGKHRTTILQNFQKCKNENKSELCYNAEFTSSLCKLLNVKAILLVRDPRGVMQSRLRLPHCNESSDCIDPSLLCADMISDYVAARKILQQYPDKLMVMRFEELALQPNTEADRIINFLKTKRTQAFDDFLHSHTNSEEAGQFSSSRLSRNIPYKWKTVLDFNYVNEIQLACSDAMNLWGYKMAHNETHMKSTDFNPVNDYTMS